MTFVNSTHTLCHTQAGASFLPSNILLSFLFGPDSICSVFQSLESRQGRPDTPGNCSADEFHPDPAGEIQRVRGSELHFSQGPEVSAFTSDWSCASPSTDRQSMRSVVGHFDKGPAPRGQTTSTISKVTTRSHARVLLVVELDTSCTLINDKALLESGDTASYIHIHILRTPYLIHISSSLVSSFPFSTIIPSNTFIMAAVSQDFSASPSKGTYPISHPFCPLTASEITTTADLLRSVWPSTIDLRFKVITLDEPAKKSMIPYLEAEHSGSPLPEIPRKAFVSYYIRNTVSSRA